MNNKKIMVLGMARSGVAAAKLLAERGARVRISDMKTEEKLGDALSPLKDIENIEWRLGEPDLELLEGMDMLVLSPGVPIESPVVEGAKQRGIEVIGELELAARISTARLIAITGTNGKTTTTSLTGEIFKASGARTHVVGNIGYPFSAVAGETRPEDVVVCEASSFQLESVDTFKPAVACITNIREDHLNRHHTMQCYAQTKAHIFRTQTESDWLVLNYDDEGLRALAPQAKGRVAWFSRTQVPPMGAFVRDGMIVFGTVQEYVAVCGAEELLIPGPHNLDNALCAVAMTMLAGVRAADAAGALRTFRGVEHRVEFVRELDGVRFIDDSEGTNADSTIKAVETMKAGTVMILGGSDKKNDFTALCTAIKNSPFISHVVLIGQTANQFDETLRRVGYSAISHAGYDFKAAIEMAFSLASKGGNVLLSPACASFDMFNNCEERGDIFKDIVMKMESKSVK